MAKIIGFISGPFSQWYISLFTVNGIQYNCCEQYMMAQKALLFNDQPTYTKIMATSEPKKQKALGRKVANFDETKWINNRERIVYEGNLEKFKQNDEIKKVLLDTKDATICEAAPYDKIWGIGLHKTDPKVQDKTQWKGLNLLGTALMSVRDNL